MRTVVLKLGGALITDKRKGVFDRAREGVIRRIAEEVANAIEGGKVGRLILVHGAGSFGHPYVEKYGVERLEKDVWGVSDTHLACERLCGVVCKALIEAGVPPAPVHPFSCFRVEGNRILFDRSVFAKLIEDGFVPVTHGDVVRGGRGWKVLSGDDIAVELALHFGAERVGFATNTQLVVNGRRVEEFSLSSSELSLEAHEAGRRVSDVTGGMAGKLRKVEKVVRRSEVFIFSGLKRGSVSAFLNGEKVGTKILP